MLLYLRQCVFPTHVGVDRGGVLKYAGVAVFPTHVGVDRSFCQRVKAVVKYSPHTWGWTVGTGIPRKGAPCKRAVL